MTNTADRCQLHAAYARARARDTNSATDTLVNADLEPAEARAVGATHQPLREVVSNRIREMIQQGELQPGQRLFEDRLAEQLGVSRNPVREAIRALEATGLVVVAPRRGASVAVFDAAAAAKLLDLRAALEAYSARLASQNRTPEQLAAMRATLDLGRAATAAGDVVGAARAHREFHLCIEASADNPYIGPVVEPLRMQTELVFSKLVDQRGLVGWEQHVDIMKAIAAGDGNAAEDATRRHMKSVLDDLLGDIPEMPNCNDARASIL